VEGIVGRGRGISVGGGVSVAVAVGVAVCEGGTVRPGWTVGVSEAGALRQAVRIEAANNRRVKA
jgi:hypothetical protein